MYTVTGIILAVFTQDAIYKTNQSVVTELQQFHYPGHYTFI
jgi:hypothetical protein